MYAGVRSFEGNFVTSLMMSMMEVSWCCRSCFLSFASFEDVAVGVNVIVWSWLEGSRVGGMRMVGGGAVPDWNNNVMFVIITY